MNYIRVFLRQFKEDQLGDPHSTGNCIDWFQFDRSKIVESCDSYKFRLIPKQSVKSKDNGDVKKEEVVNRKIPIRMESRLAEFQSFDGRLRSLLGPIIMATLSKTW